MQSTHPKATRLKQSKGSISFFRFALLVMTAFLSVVYLHSFLATHGFDMALERQNPILQALTSYQIQTNDAAIDPNSPLAIAQRAPPQVIPNDETPLPNPPLANGHDTFSACLLVMDDNHRLAEWMAYHYHVMPLRTLIVANDPRSLTSPTAVLNRWRQKGVHIDEWKDQDFWLQNLQAIPDDAPLQTKRDRHRGRQKFFYKECLKQLRANNRTWVTLHDTDEYLVYNHAGGEDFAAWEAQQQKYHQLSKNADKQRIPPTITPPTTAQEGAMIQYIRHEQQAGLEYYQSPCIGLPRLQFSAADTLTDRQNTSKHVPLSLYRDIPNAALLDTIRWRKHAPRNDFVKNALGKVLLDVSRVDIAKTPQFMSLHRPIKKICKAPWHDEWSSGLRLNHYLGSWESYSARANDARRGFERSREQWEYKSATNAIRDDDNIQPWIGGFVAKHGVEETNALLQGVRLANKPQENDQSWHLLPEKLSKILSTNITVANDNKQVAFDAFVRKKYQENGQQAD